MVDHVVPEDLLNFDWEKLLDNVPDDWSFDLVDHGPLISTSPESGCSLSLEGIEQYLLNDDDDCSIDVQADKGSNADVFVLDLSPESELNQSKDTPSPETLTGEGRRDEEKAGDDALNKEENNGVDVVEGEDDGENDPAAKKRKRQIRNRDAAVRSRERKKMYVKDLEMKSKYYESECKRLGIMLQCCMAENQALRLSLHSSSSRACDASVAKQESAVLLLELLLLGSLLGFLGIISPLLLLNLEKGPPLVVGLELARVEPTRTNKGLRELVLLPSSMMGKTCKASRTRIKSQLEVIV